MSDIQLSIKQTEIKEIVYKNDFIGTGGKQLQLEIKTNAKVILNMAAPLSAVVNITFTAVDPTDEKIKLVIDTLTPITVSSFVDNLDKVIQEKYFPSIMLAVNEKIRAVTSTVGLSLRVPNLTFAYDK